MSKLKVTTIADPDNDNTAISIDTSGNITIPNNATFTGTVTGAGGGKVLQVVSTTKTDTFTTTATTPSYATITGLTVSITPSSTSSKILVFGEVFMSNAGDGQQLVMHRDSTAICVGDTAGSRPRVSGSISLSSQYWSNKVSASYLDAPSTTSAITYSFKVAGGGSTVYVNRTQGDRDSTTYDPRGASTITVMEIGA